MGMTGGFIGVFMYQEGYSLLFISLFFVCYFAMRTIIALPSALFVAKFGPKRANLVSNLMFIPGMAAISLIPHIGIWALAINLILGSTSRTLYEVSYLVNFSKIKHIEHAGKEIGGMEIIDRITSAFSPLVGGLIAFTFGPEVMIVTSAIILSVSAGPLFFTAEPVRVNQKITLRGFNIKKVWRTILASVAVGIELNISGVQWYLLIFIIVLGGASGNTVYAEIGALGSVTVISGLIAAYVFGRIVDKKRGGELLKFSVFSSSALHLIRPFIQTPLSAAAMNISSEVSATGYKMPFMKGLFDTADSLPGYRIVYVSIIAAAYALGDTIAVAVLALGVFLWGDVEGLRGSYIILAPITLLIATHGFAVYRKRHFISRLVRT